MTEQIINGISPSVSDGGGGGITPNYVQYTKLGIRKRFRVFVHPTRRHFADAMCENAKEMKQTKTRMTRGVTGAKFCIREYCLKMYEDF